MKRNRNKWLTLAALLVAVTPLVLPVPRPVADALLHVLESLHDPEAVERSAS